MLTSQMHRPPRNHMPEEFVLTERRRPFKQGASDFLSSPLDSHELISTIARAYCSRRSFARHVFALPKTELSESFVLTLPDSIYW